MARRSQPAWAVLFAALQASHETGHDDDGQHLHRPLRGDGKKVIAHRPADLGKVRIGLAQLNTTYKLVGSR